MDLVPADHMAHFVRETVREELDLSAIFARYEDARGQPPFHPAMMVALLLYGYSRGVYSSRKLMTACEERVDFLAVTAMAKPDFRTIAKFRRRHLKALGDLFVQVLRLCQAAGLVRLGHVALDGTKIQANASLHKAMSYGRMRESERRLKAEIAAWFAKAEAADAAEDKEYSPDRRGNELPTWVADKQARVAKIKAARQALEAEARAAAESDGTGGKDDGPGPSTGMRKAGAPQANADGGPPDRAQRNFTDPDSRVLASRGGWVQGYNAQIAVDAENQIVVAQCLGSQPVDAPALPKLIAAIRTNCGANPDEVSADSGYCTEANLVHLARRRIAGYIATGRVRHRDGRSSRKSSLVGRRVAAMAAKLARAARRSRYRLRKQTVEPVFGQIKAARGFRQFLLRGLESVRSEWAMICTAHNMAKLARARA